MALHYRPSTSYKIYGVNFEIPTCVASYTIGVAVWVQPHQKKIKHLMKQNSAQRYSIDQAQIKSMVHAGGCYKDDELLELQQYESPMSTDTHMP